MRESKPTKTCIHAKWTIEGKRSYNEQEKEDGCWTCGGVLTLVPSKKIESLAQLGNYSMSKGLRESLEKDPEEATKILAMLNNPVWHCDKCFHEGIEKSRQEFKEGKCISIEQFIAQIESEKYAQTQRDLIKEIQACGPDCPWYNRLEQLQKDYGVVE